jgi:hypothetical protein
VSVEKYRAYTELMERNGGDDVASAFQFNAAIMKMVFGISEREVLKADVTEQMAAAKMIHFVMQDIITQKFLELNPNRPEEVEKEKSAFDEYDEENGYNEAENQLDDENIWKVCRDNADRVVKLCIKWLNDSLSNVMKSDIMSLLDHVAFEIKTINEK